MNKHIKNLLVAAGLLALGVSSANAAYKAATSGPYNTNVRIEQGTVPNEGALWIGSPGAQTRGLSIDNNGDVLVASNTRILALNDADGTQLNANSINTGVSSARAFSQSANGTYWVPSGGDVKYFTSTDFTTPASASTSVGTKLITVNDKLFTVTTAGGSTIQRYSISGTTLSIDSGFSSSGMSSQIRNLAYLNGNIYAYLDDRTVWTAGTGLGAFTQVTGLGALAGSSTAEGIGMASLNGSDYMFVAGSSGIDHGIYIYNMTSATAAGSYDFYDSNPANVLDRLGTSGSNQTLAIAVNSSRLYLSLQNDNRITAFNIVAVPEPSTYAMMALGLVMSAYGLKISRRKKQSVNKA